MRPILSKAESARLSANLIEQKRRDPLTQMPDHYRVIVPETVFRKLAACGRKRYSAIVYVAHMSLRWKGWKSRKKRGRVEHGVMLTRRFMHAHYGYNHCTTATAIETLRDLELLELMDKAVYSGKAGTNKGNAYKPLWMYQKDGKHNAWLFWGPFTSEEYLTLDIVSQAVFVLLHLRLHRKQARIACRPGDLAEFGVSRKIVTKHLNQLMHAGLLEHVDGHIYEFPWLVSHKEVDMSQLTKKTASLKQAGGVPKTGQVRNPAKPESVPKAGQERRRLLSLKQTNYAYTRPLEPGRMAIFVAKAQKHTSGQQNGGPWLPTWHTGSEQLRSHG